MSGDDDEGRFLTAGQIGAYGHFVGALAVEDLERFFFLDDVDRKLVRARRGVANRLGFALQVCRPPKGASTPPTSPPCPTSRRTRRCPSR
jgi:hypothetical protein